MPAPRKIYMFEDEKERGTLAKAARLAQQSLWKDTRYSGMSYLKVIVQWLMEVQLRRDLNAVTENDMELFIESRRADGITSSSTLNKYLSSFKMMRDKARKQIPPLCSKMVTLPRVRRVRVLKWWLPPERMEELLKHLRTPDVNNITFHEIADLVEFICCSGLRIEETLRITPDCMVGTDELKVPGTKSEKAERTIPLGDRAYAILKRRSDRMIRKTDSIFRMSMEFYRTEWNYACRSWLGANDISTATLKSLRRTFAKRVTDNGMPTAILRDILGHENLATTQEYLDLVGDKNANKAIKDKWL